MHVVQNLICAIGIDFVKKKKSYHMACLNNEHFKSLRKLKINSCKIEVETNLSNFWTLRSQNSVTEKVYH